MREDELNTEARTTELLAELDWLRGLARALISAEDRAEDLVHETSLAALQVELPERGRLRAWLARALRFRLSLARRSDRRRLALEREVAQVERQPAAVEVCARVERQKIVVEEVLALRSIHREVVLLRYFEDLPPRRIAAELALPLDTVYSRLKRGLAELRRRLEVRFGSRTERRRALMPIALAPPLGKGLLSAGLSTTVLAMKTKLIVAAAAALVLIPAGVWFTEALLVEGAPPSAKESAQAPVADRDVAPVQFHRDESPPDLGAPTTPVEKPTPVAKGLRIQVVDQQGKPVFGAPVALLSHSEGRPKILWKGLTGGSEGIATVDPIPEWDPQEQEVFALFDGHFLNPPHERLVHGVIPAKPILLVIPPCGRMILELHHACGEEIAIPGRIDLKLLGPHEDLEALKGSLLEHSIGWGRELRPIEGRQLVLPFVELGWRFRAICHLSGMPFGDYPTFDVAGPQREGEEVRHQLTVAPHFVRVKVHGPDGKTLTNRSIQVCRRTYKDGRLCSSGLMEVVTDKDGQLHFYSQWTEHPAVEYRLILALEWKSRNEGEDVSMCLGTVLSGPAASLVLPGSSKPGVNDLGYVVLETLPLLVTGRVVDERNEPLEDVELLVGRSNPGLARPGPVTKWSCEGAAISDASGRFTVRGFGLGESICVWGSKQGFSPAGALVRGGAERDLVLCLARAASLRGKLLVGEGISPHELNLKLRGDQLVPIPFEADADGTLHIAPLASGNYSLEVKLGGWELLKIEDLVLGSGQELLDPRLNPLDLRERLHVLELELIEAQGNPIAEKGVNLFCQDRPRIPFDGKTDASGITRITIPSSVQNMSLRVQEYRTLRIDSALSPQRLVLHRSLKVHVEVSEAPGVEHEGDDLVLLFYRERDGGWEKKEAARTSYKSKDRKEIALPGAGLYRLEWRVRGITRNPVGFKTFPSVAVKAEEAQVLEITEEDGGRVYRLAPPREPLAEAWKELRELLAK